MLLDDTHKLKLLEIVEQNPSDIALLLDYLKEKLDVLPSDLEGEDQETLKFFVIKSFADEISNFQSEKKLESVNELLEELEEAWDAYFDEKLNYKNEYSLTIKDTTYYTELDFSGSEEEMVCDSDNILSSELAKPELIKELPEVRFNLAQDIDLKKEITLEQLNILLKISLLPESSIAFPTLNQYVKTLAMKIFSIGDSSANIFNNNLEFANAIIYLTDKFNQNQQADYNTGLTLCVIDSEVTSQDILPLSGEAY
ncbi:hypothetical protein [Rickettsia endosymbiont of Gonocerus acuteangulatus]|uniref:hypothetical protein n=1 Tax=Rickettsia endosymbiont of Gonocerus acuteangulatus TaxID=3066266 RepID=UPI00313335B8